MEVEIGAFSVSLAVKDLQAATAFYEKLGFRRTGGDGSGYLIMVNGGATIGLFQGMFEGNILTFNPGLRQDGSQVTDFTDVRDIRESLLANGIEMKTDTDPAGTGPAHIVIHDPDGNPILIDQFYPKPGSETDAAAGKESVGCST